jgi:VanZ family protein
MLAILAFNAVRTTFAQPLASAAIFGGIWYLVPNIDETIQRYVPGRAGMTSDVLLDMCGFACGFALCLVCAGIASLFRRDS